MNSLQNTSYQRRDERIEVQKDRVGNREDQERSRLLISTCDEKIVTLACVGEIVRYERG
jgi:hypothetical protein